MRSSTLNLLLFAVVLVALDAQAQTERKQQPETVGSISGRVTLAGQPAAGVKVIAVKRENSFQEEPVASAKTDWDGRFQLKKLPSDHYNIVPFAPAYVVSEQMGPEQPGKSVALAEGETIEGLDFTLIRGGVITGRITSQDGQPITGEMVTLNKFDSEGRSSQEYHFATLPHYDFRTDDQGTYRIFGLPAGRYLVGAGKATDPGYHPRTFYRGVADVSKAGVVELTAGTVATGIDITLGNTAKTYSASGRVIDGNTGRAFPNAQFVMEYPERVLGHGRITSGTGLKSDARGNFRFDGLPPGEFRVTVATEEKSDLYSNVVSFQVKDQNIAGLEIKVRRGSSVSGVLAIEGANDPEVLARLSLLTVVGSSPDNRGPNNRVRFSAVDPDGGFHITGLQPGRVFLHVSSDPDTKGTRGFSVLRVERGGVEYAKGIEVGSDEHVADMRVILGYASGRIRGQVKIQDGKLPADAEITVFVRRVDGPSEQGFPRVVVDPNGRFVIEHLITGEYEISVYIFGPSPTPNGGVRSQLARTEVKRVSVTNGAESEVLIAAELTAKDKDQQ